MSFITKLLQRWSKTITTTGKPSTLSIARAKTRAKMYSPSYIIHISFTIHYLCVLLPVFHTDIGYPWDDQCQFIRFEYSQTLSRYHLGNKNWQLTMQYKEKIEGYYALLGKWIFFCHSEIQIQVHNLKGLTKNY